MTQVVSTFKGMAPRFAPALRKGMAQVAEDIDLSSGKIKAGAGHLVVGAGSGDSLVYSNGAWVSGSGRCFCPWVVDGSEILFSLVNGVASKTVGGVTADLGQVLPGAPTVVSLSAGQDLCDDDTYVFDRSESTDPVYYLYRPSIDPPGLGTVTFTRTDIESVYVDDVQYTQGDDITPFSPGTLAPGQWAFLNVGTETLGGLAICFLADPSPLVSFSFTPSDYFTSIALVVGSGNVDGTFSYAVTTTRNVGGIEDESGPGTVSASITVNHEILRVTRPTISDALVTHWTLYRLGSDSGEFQFCAKLAVGTTYYDDNLLVSDLGAAPLTYYTSDQGNDILFSKPVAFDGLTGPHAAMLFGWKDSTLYWSEPGKPDGWPAYYSMNFPSRIKTAVPFSGALAVMCEKGAYRVDGTHPELLQQNPGMGSEPCFSTFAAETSKGVVYMSDSGVAVFNLYETAVLTDALFSEAWFKGINRSSAFFAENDGRVYVFHAEGALVYEKGADAWTTLSLVATAAFKRPDTGELYVISGGEVLQVGGGTAMPYRFLSGDYYGNGGDDTEFKGVRVAGSGAVTLGVYVDGDLKVTRALDFTMDRGKVVQLRQEHAGRALWFELTGTGDVTEVVVL